VAFVPWELTIVTGGLALMMMLFGFAWWLWRRASRTSPRTSQASTAVSVEEVPLAVTVRLAKDATERLPPAHATEVLDAQALIERASPAGELLDDDDGTVLAKRRPPASVTEEPDFTAKIEKDHLFDSRGGWSRGDQRG
jgi:hypothetical protein